MVDDITLLHKNQIRRSFRMPKGLMVNVECDIHRAVTGIPPVLNAFWNAN